MKTLLTIDLGNSHPTAGLFIDHQLQTLLPWKQAEKWTHRYPFIISSVQTELPCSLKSNDLRIRHQPFHQNRTFAGMPIQYTSTLGEDRLVQAAYLFNTQKKNDLQKGLLLIDAGTFITVDHINHKGFLGGHILPGVQTLLDSYSKGARLPHFYKEELTTVFSNPNKQAPPQTTKEAVQDSIRRLYQLFFIDLLKQFTFGKVIYTGGDGSFLKDNLSSTQESKNIQVIPHLIHHSLHFLARTLQ